MLVPNISGWIARHKQNVVGWLRIAQAVTALVLLTLAFHTGKTRFVLLTEGVRAAGRIVDYKEERFSTRSVGNMTRTTTMSLPVVQFQAAGQVVTFTDWMGSPAAGEINDAVTVLYDPARPSVAMIDRPVWNWMPWAPFFAIGAFLLTVALRGWYVHERASVGRTR